MAKNNFLSWDTLANNNTDVSGINVAEGCAPSGINNAIRAMMAQLRSGVDGNMVYVTKSANYTALGTDNNAYYRFSASATLSLTAVATLAANWHMWLKADGGDVTIDPNASETINGGTTLVIRNGESALIVSSGSAFFASVNPSNTPFQYQLKTANYTALDGDYNSTIRFTSAATLAFDVTANLRTNWRIEVWNDSTGPITIDPDSTNTINGLATLSLQPGQRMEVYKTSSTTFQGAFYADTYSGPQLQGYYFGLGLTTAAGDTANDVTIAVGSAAADTANYDLMQLTSALTKQIDAAWAIGNNAGGLDTGSVGNNTYYIWLIRRPDTGVVDVLYSLSSTAPTMPTNYTQKRLVGRLTRVSATNGPPGSLNDLNPLGLKYGTLITASTAAININSGIPSDAKRITIVSELSSASGLQALIQLGTGGVLETSGYVGAAAVIGGGTANATPSTSFLLAVNASVAGPYYGVVTLTRQDPSLNKWILSSQLSENSGSMTFASGSKTLAGALDRIQISSVAGSVSFSGTLNIIVERF